ncbi:MAG: V-type ATP synthase subunit E [Synergistales bacterium]|nr:V-type ATP synthase subunit E [Synergistales bacterium]
MSLADIKSKIETDAKKEAEQIIEKATGSAEEILMEADKEIQAIKENYSERFKKEEPEIANRREIVARLDVKKIELGTKQELIAESFNEAVNILASLPKQKYLDFISALLGKSMETGKEEVLVGEKEKNLNKTWLDSYNEAQKVSLTLSKEKLPISGGFILRNGDIDTNCSFDMLVSWAREDLEADVVKRLFSA